MADKKKLAAGIGIVAATTGIILLATKAKAAPPEPGLANLYGKVTDAETGQKIPDVLVTLNGTQAYTDAAGNYAFADFEPGEYALQFSKAGYETLVMTDMIVVEGNNELNIEMAPIPLIGVWVKPTGYIDEIGDWSTPEYAYDGRLNFGAYRWQYAESWGDYLTLTLNEAYIESIRFYARHYPDRVEIADIDVYYEGAWHDVYEGWFPDRVWVEKAIPAGIKLVSKARFRFYNQWSTPAGTYLYEFEFYAVELGG